MELIPALSLLVATVLILLLVLWKFEPPHLLQMLDGSSFMLVASILLFLVVGVIYLFRQPEWTPDLLKLLGGVVVGASGGAKLSKPGNGSRSGGVDVAGSSFGEGARIAGRDLNEIIEEMHSNVSQIRDSVVNQISQVSQILEETGAVEDKVVEYLFYTAFLMDAELVAEAATITRQLQPNGWSLFSAMPSYVDTEGLVLLYRRVRDPEDSDTLIPGTKNYRVRFYHGRNQIEVDYAGG